MSFGLGEAVLNITANVADFNAALGKAERTAKSTFGNIASSAKTIGLGMMGLGTGILTASGLAIREAGESQKILAQTDAVLKSTGEAAGMSRDALIELATGLQKITTYDDAAILGGENLLLTFAKIGKDIFPLATETVLDMSTALGQDLKSSSIQLGKALQDPVKGVTALRRVGVMLTEDQKSMIETLGACRITP